MEMARTFLEVLLGDSHSYSPQTPASRSRPEWTCKECSCSNYMSRAKCRGCGKPWQSSGHAPKLKETSRPNENQPRAEGGFAPRPAPWEKTQAAAARATALKAALEAAKTAGGDADLVQDLQAKYERAQKDSSDERPITDRLAGCRAYIERAEKRLDSAESALTEARQMRDQRAEDLAKHQHKLKELEDEVAASRRASDMVLDMESELPNALEAFDGEFFRGIQQQLAAVQAERDQAVGAAREAGSSCAQMQGQLQALTEERDNFRSQIPFRSEQEVMATDVPTLEGEIVRLQQELGEAMSSSDPEGYQRKASEHAKVSDALVRALRLRPRVR